MTTLVTFALRDEIAAQMSHESPNIYFDVFGRVVLRKSDDPFDTETVGQWWIG